MTTITVSSKGQITLPASFRRKANITAGKRLQVRVQGKTLLLQVAPDFFSMKGCLGKGKAESERSDAEDEAAQHVMGNMHS